VFLTIVNLIVVCQSDLCNIKIAKYMNWFLLALAGLIELGFTFSLGKVSKTFGLERVVWIALVVVSITISLSLVAKVIKEIPIGTAYAIWTGIGAVGTVLIGIVFFKEPVSAARLFFMVTLVCSIIGLKLVSH